jgi:glutaminyl-tRNA synthetase
MSEGDDFTKFLNPNSLETLTLCRIESSLAGATPGSKYQFERLGYFCVDLKHSSPKKLVLNRIATLRDSWAKISGQEKK